MKNINDRFFEGEKISAKNQILPKNDKKTRLIKVKKISSQTKYF